MECAGRAQRRRRFGWFLLELARIDLRLIQSGVALRLPPHSKGCAFPHGLIPQVQ